MGTINMSQLYGTTPVAKTVDSGRPDQGDSLSASTGGQPLPTSPAPVAAWVVLIAMLVAARVIYEQYGKD